MKQLRTFMTNEEDAKETAKQARKTPQTEKILRQFLSLESGNYVSSKMREHYDVAVNGSTPLAQPSKCCNCDYVANTLAELRWHEEKNLGHVCDGAWRNRGIR